MADKSKIKWWHIALAIIAFLALVVFIFLLPYFSMIIFNPPHLEKISISLPFAPENEAIGISPAGELLYHDGGLGHCGLDFGFDKNAELIASAEGKIIELAHRKGWDVGIATGDYVIRYGLLEDYNRELKIGSKVSKGEFIGYAQEKLGKGEEKGNASNYAFHFEFATLLSVKYPWLERLCPYTYFDADSKARIDKIWENDKWPYREIYPNICSGGYAGRDTLADAIRLDKTGYDKTFNMTRDRELANQIDERNKQNSDDKKEDCKQYSIENCPKGCIVCPPCEVCSSVSCNTNEFCSKMGFNETWYYSVSPNTCSEESRTADACPAIYSPVCGWFNSTIKCIKYPCAATYSNSCEACRDSKVAYWVGSECPPSGNN
ncbi:MAG: M23 family metallopeptidase [archaeon]